MSGRGGIINHPGLAATPPSKGGELNHQPHTAQPVVDIVRRGIEIRTNRVVMPLTQHLRIGVNVLLFQRAKMICLGLTNHLI